MGRLQGTKRCGGGDGAAVVRAVARAAAGDGEVLRQCLAEPCTHGTFSVLETPCGSSRLQSRVFDVPPFRKSFSVARQRDRQELTLHGFGAARGGCTPTPRDLLLFFFMPFVSRHPKQNTSGATRRSARERYTPTKNASLQSGGAVCGPERIVLRSRANLCTLAWRVPPA